MSPARSYNRGRALMTALDYPRPDGYSRPGTSGSQPRLSSLGSASWRPVPENAHVAGGVLPPLAPHRIRPAASRPGSPRPMTTASRWRGMEDAIRLCLHGVSTALRRRRCMPTSHMLRPSASRGHMTNADRPSGRRSADALPAGHRPSPSGEGSTSMADDLWPPPLRLARVRSRRLDPCVFGRADGDPVPSEERVPGAGLP